MVMLVAVTYISLSHPYDYQYKARASDCNARKDRVRLGRRVLLLGLGISA